MVLQVHISNTRMTKESLYNARSVFCAISNTGISTMINASFYNVTNDYV